MVCLSNMTSRRPHTTNGVLAAKFTIGLLCVFYHYNSVIVHANLFYDLQGILCKRADEME